MIFLVYCIVSLFYDLFVLSQALHDMFHTPVARYSPFLLKVSLNANRLNYQKKTTAFDFGYSTVIDLVPHLRRCVDVQCDAVPDERRYQLPLHSHYLQQLRHFVGLE